MRTFLPLLGTTVLAVFLGACGDFCTASWQCGANEVCMNIEPAPGEGRNRCVVQCAKSAIYSPECEAAGVPGQCFCDDSPAGARCKVVDAPAVEGTFYCGG